MCCDYGRRGRFWPKDHSLNLFTRGLRGDVTYQLSDSMSVVPDEVSLYMPI